jgi:hypothetical protein
MTVFISVGLVREVTSVGIRLLEKRNNWTTIRGFERIRVNTSRQRDVNNFRSNREKNRAAVYSRKVRVGPRSQKISVDRENKFTDFIS